MIRWLCLFTNKIDEVAARKYIEAGYSVWLGPDHPGYENLSLPSIIAFEPDCRSVAIEARELWKRMGSARVQSGQTLREYVTDDGVCLWDVCASNLVLYYLQKVIRNVACMQRFLAGKEKPNQVVVDSRTDLAARWLIDWARKNGSAVEVIKDGQVFSKTVSLRKLTRKHLRRLRNWLLSHFTIRGHSGNAEVLFLGYVDRQLDSMIPVAKSLRELHNMQVRFMLPFRSRRRAELRSLGFKCDVYEKYPASRSLLRRSVRPIGYRDMGSRIVDILSVYEPEFSQSLWKMLDQAAEYRGVARSVIERLKPALLITSDVNHPLIRAFCLGANQLGLNSINLPYGLVGDNSIEWSLMPQTATCAMGPRSAQVISSWHGVQLRVEETGSPRHDSWHSPRSEMTRLARRSALRIAEFTTAIAYFSVPADQNYFGSIDGALRQSERNLMLRTVCEAALALTSTVLLVIAHPEETIEELSKVLGDRITARVKVMHAPKVKHVLEAIDLAVTCHSTTGIEAVFLGVPLVTINLTGRPDPAPYASDLGIKSVLEPNALLPALREALSDDAWPERRRSFLNLHMRHTKHGAAVSIADIAADMVAGARKL